MLKLSQCMEMHVLCYLHVVHVVAVKTTAAVHLNRNCILDVKTISKL